MQHRLAPDFILENLTLGTQNGRFEGAAMFLDVSGFSAIMDTLMQHGQHGSEIMALLMRTLFDPLVASVYAHNGYIVGFAGDAFTAVFPSRDGQPHATLSALAAALEMQLYLEANDQYATEYGSFQIGAKVGLAYGEIEWGILQSKNNKRATFFYKGTAVQQCADAEHYAAKKEIVCHHSFNTHVSTIVNSEQRDNFYCITAVHTPLPQPNPLTPPNQSPDLMRHFFPEQIISQTVSGEFRQILNLFINLQGTPNPEQLSQFMTLIFTLQDRYGGLLNRIDFGDKGCHLLFFWGAPISFENDISRVLGFVQDLRQQSLLSMRMGITYRIAHAGYIGSELHEEYTCYGRGVNLAARFMTSANWDETWVDAEIAERAHNQFHFESLGEKQFKGFAEPQSVYLMQSRYQIDQTPFYQGQLVGREQELRQLDTLAEPLKNGRFAGVVVISGEAGIGKSRLVHEYLDNNTSFQKAKVLRCQTDEIIRQSLNPFRYWLRDYFNQSPTDDETINKASFEYILNTLINKTIDPALRKELDRTRSFLGALLGLNWRDSLYEQLEPQLRFENSLNALKMLIKAESTQQSIIIQLEDAQWMDEDSWGFLKLLSRNIEEMPLLILITTRAGFPKDVLDEDIPFQTIQLSNLTQAAAKELIIEKIGHSPKSAFFEWIMARTEGHPFFVEQMLLYLEENNLLTQTTQQLEALKSSQLLPTDVRSVLTARLDQLPSYVKNAVQTASVLGREFDKPVMIEMLHDAAQTEQTLVTGTKESIWVSLSQIRYLFRHMLFRDAAYEMQVHTRLKTLHQQAATAFETVYQTDLTPHYGEIAYHFDQAMVTVKAVGYYERAADHARESYRNEEALEYYNRALTLVKSGETDSRFRLLLGKEAILGWLGKREEQAAVLEQLESDLLFKDDSAKVSQLALRQAAFALSIGRYNQAIAAAKRSAETAVVTQNTLGEALAYHRWGRAHWSQGHYPKARPILEKAQALLDGTEYLREQGLVLYDLSIIDYYESLFDQALEKLDQALKINQKISNSQGLISCLSMNGVVLGALGNHEQAQGQLTLALETCQEVGWRFGEVRTLTQIGNSHFELGSYELSEKYIQDAQAVFKEINDREGQSASLDSLGLVMFFSKNLEAAETYLKQALALDELTDNQRNRAYALTHLGYVYTTLENFSLASDALETALHIRQQIKAIGPEMDTLGGLAQLAFVQDDLPAAKKHAEEILAYIENEGSAGLELPIFTYLICVRVLTAVAQQNPEYQPLVQKTYQHGYELLMKQAQNIKNPTLRTQFLKNVPYNKAFLLAK